MKKILIGSLILSLIILASCSIFKPYSISDFEFEKKDLDNRQHRDSARVFFYVNNKADTTLVPALTVDIDDDCFSPVADKDLGDMPPNSQSRSYVQLYLPYNVPDECVGKPFEFTIYLRDINGKVLDSHKDVINIIWKNDKNN